MTKEKRISAFELLNQLENDPGHQARQKRHKLLQKQSEALHRSEQLDILHELAQVGVKADSVWELVNRKDDYEDALPVLARHLRYPYSDVTTDGIARALAVPRAKFAWDDALSAYQQRPNAAQGQASAKDGLAILLASIADESVLSDLIRLVSDATNGESRIFLLPALKASKSQDARLAILRLRFDPQLAAEISSWKDWLKRNLY